MAADANDIVNSLVYRSMQHNYTYACEKHGVENQDRISEGMQILYGDTWERGKEQIWQWFDATDGDCESLETISVDLSKGLL